MKSIQTNQRRITMSLRAAVQERERREERTAMREVNTRADADGPLRLGDLFGKELRAMRNRQRDVQGAAEGADQAPVEEETTLNSAGQEAPIASADAETTTSMQTEEVPSETTDGEPDSAPANPGGNEPVEG